MKSGRKGRIWRGRGRCRNAIRMEKKRGEKTRVRKWNKMDGTVKENEDGEEENAK